MKLPQPLELARRCCVAAEDKKARDVVVIDLREKSSLADFFVIASAANEPQLKAIANELRKAMKEEWNLLPDSTDGFPASQWIVVDYGDVIVHLFRDEMRGLYQLEELWSDCPRVAV